MQSILESRTSARTDSDSSDSDRIKAASAPIPPKASEIQVKTQISAPCYLFSLKENDAPPFKKPEKEARPRILIGSIMREEDVIEMIAAAENGMDAMKKSIGNYLVEKQIVANYHLSEKNLLTSLLVELIDYAAQRDFSAFKLACLMTVYLDTHVYFKWYYWSSPVNVWLYFKEVMIRHTIEDSPDGEEVFEPDECYDIVTHFHTVYLSNLPLVHILTFGAHRLKVTWPFKMK